MQPRKAYNNENPLRLVNNGCFSCGSKLIGRAGKRFCDQKCRSAYSNSLNAPANNAVRKIRNALNKNRRILQAFLIGKENTKVLRDDLLVDGYQLKYHTHTRPNSKGQMYIYCYEFGYLELEGNYILIVRDK